MKSLMTPTLNHTIGIITKLDTKTLKTNDDRSPHDFEEAVVL